MIDLIFESLKNGLVVSCQAEEGSPFNSPERVKLFADAAVMGGAVGIRSEGIEKTAAIINAVNLPVIGLVKTKFEDGTVCITGSTNSVNDLIEIKSNILAIDGTFRLRENLTGPEFIKKIKKDFNLIIMADVSTFEEGVACADSGADCISTTLSGYTTETKNKYSAGPDFELVEKLVANLSIPVFAEGRINTPADAARMINLGAWGVVAGTAITRPNIITEWYVNEIRRSSKK
jgi:N-acylglucosamine-6-phosphate 2-epimerase